MRREPVEEMGFYARAPVGPNLDRDQVVNRCDAASRDGTGDRVRVRGMEDVVRESMKSPPAVDDINELRQSPVPGTEGNRRHCVPECTKRLPDSGHIATKASIRPRPAECGHLQSDTELVPARRSLHARRFDRRAHDERAEADALSVLNARGLPLMPASAGTEA